MISGAGTVVSGRDAGSLGRGELDSEGHDLTLLTKTVLNWRLKILEVMHPVL